MKILKQIFFILNSKERSQVFLLFLVILSMALIDMLGVASILPFMSVLTNPEIIETNYYLKKIFQSVEIYGIDNKQDFIFFIGLFTFVLLIFSLLVRAFTTYFQVKFVQMCEYSIGKRIVESYLHQPYSWFLNRHSADIGKTVLSEMSLIIGSGINPLINLLTQFIVSITLIVLLLVVDLKITITVILILGGSYIIIFLIAKKYLKIIGGERFKSNEIRYKSLIEVFGAIKEIKAIGLEQLSLKRFSGPAYVYAKTSTLASMRSQIPRYFLEAIAFGGSILIILYLLKNNIIFNEVLPLISLFVFAGYRLLPGLQQIYVAFTQLSFISPSLDKLYNDFKKFDPIQLDKDKSVLKLHKEITLNNIDYSYPNQSVKTLQNLNLKIPARTSIAFVGTTGSGKTTTADIILGLIEAQNGTLDVDGQIISKKNLRSWQRTIGYVPQQIFLSDDTIIGNIAFSKKHNDVDIDAVIKASKIANLDDFVMNELPQKYETVIGERGVRLSGGQRQRIGIARALYHNPQLLILDEATSSLDIRTEKLVMDAISNLNSEITIIIIAHRLNTIKNCEKIVLMEKGRIKKIGTYDEIIKDSNFKNST